MATLLRLKAEIEHNIFSETNVQKELKLTFVGATEAHLLVRELRHAKVGVLVRPRSFPYSWESRRMCVRPFYPMLTRSLRYFNRHSIPGPPLTPQDLVSYLVSQDVEVGIIPQGVGDVVEDAWAVQNLRFDAGWVRGFDFRRFKAGSADRVHRFIKSPTAGFPRSKPLRSRLRTSTVCSVLMTTAGRSTQAR